MGTWRTGGRRLVVGCLPSISRNTQVFLVWGIDCVFFLPLPWKGPQLQAWARVSQAEWWVSHHPAPSHRKGTTVVSCVKALSPASPSATPSVWSSFANRYEILLQYSTNCRPSGPTWTEFCFLSAENQQMQLFFFLKKKKPNKNQKQFWQCKVYETLKFSKCTAYNADVLPISNLFFIVRRSELSGSDQRGWTFQLCRKWANGSLSIAPCSMLH